MPDEFRLRLSQIISFHLTGFTTSGNGAEAIGCRHEAKGEALRISP
jgi:hypothetical protein